MWISRAIVIYELYGICTLLCLHSLQSHLVLRLKWNGDFTWKLNTFSENVINGINMCAQQTTRWPVILIKSATILPRPTWMKSHISTNTHPWLEKRKKKNPVHLKWMLIALLYTQKHNKPLFACDLCLLFCFSRNPLAGTSLATYSARCVHLSVSAHLAQNRHSPYKAFLMRVARRRSAFHSLLTVREQRSRFSRCCRTRWLCVKLEPWHFLTWNAVRLYRSHYRGEALTPSIDNESEMNLNPSAPRLTSSVTPLRARTRSKQEELKPLLPELTIILFLLKADTHQDRPCLNQ